ncbi:tetratricopeptide repeat protein [Flavobacterium sp.]|uniref:tetratricopeptide repeat protein n=1 Tax=Flavobacterium sp. TaxID=239 RepID=UPI003D0E18F0
MKTIDKYLFQALDNYPYSLEETIESLDYAFSYDAKNTMVLCLYGRIQAEQLWNYEEAKSYFQEALAINIHALEVYPYYIQTLILNEDYNEAQKLIDFALTIKGINKSEIYVKKAILFEVKQEFKNALAAIKEAKLCTLQFTFDSDITEVEKRIKGKIDLIEKKKKPKKSEKDSNKKSK